MRARRLECWRRLDLFNGAAADDGAVRAQALAGLFGEVGEGALVVPRFQCSYGYSIRLGANAFVNANRFFMDDAPITIGVDARIGPGAPADDSVASCR
ncbi:hypothetical protein ACFVWF_27900 [Rhodococcus qingshengii]|uniref:hypothetical protein n=1 Tax=Rhodococcus qingshengii TaxID=334542 RepID=UPI0036DC3F65